MAKTSDSHRGRAQVSLSLVIGLAGVVTTVLMFTLTKPGPKPIWLVWLIFGGLVAAGLIGMIAGVLALVKGRGLTRLAAVGGILLDIGLTLFGAFALWVILVVGPVFNSILS
jgi:hypothetical protein